MGWRSKHAQRWNLWDKSCLLLTLFALQLICFSSWNEKGGTKKVWSELKRFLLLTILGKNSDFWPWLEIFKCAFVTTKLTFKHVTQCYEMYLGPKRIRTHEFGDLEHQNAKSDCMWSSVCVMVKSNLWTWAKWNWLMYLALKLCQMFFPMPLIKFKKNQVKRSYYLEMSMR